MLLIPLEFKIHNGLCSANLVIRGHVHLTSLHWKILMFNQPSINILYRNKSIAEQNHFQESLRTVKKNICFLNIWK